MIIVDDDFVDTDDCLAGYDILHNTLQSFQIQYL